MRIVIAGAGDVGFHLGRLLALESHETTIIDIDEEMLDYVGKHLDVHTLHGSCTSFSILQQANVSQCDLFIAVTSEENANFTSAVMAKRLGAKKTIVRVSNIEFLINRKHTFMKDVGIDEIILPETLAAEEIKRLVAHAVLTDHFSFGQGKLSLMGIKVDDQSILLNKSLSEVFPNGEKDHFKNVAILRSNDTIIPTDETVFSMNDHSYFITDPEGEADVMKMSTNGQKEIKHIMILGGSKIGFHAARLLSKKYKVKIIDSNKTKCRMLADELANTLVIHGNHQNIELLEEENLSEMDVVIEVTENSETNIISCLMAKNRGVQKTIALVENVDYIHLSQNVGVDTMINKRLITANFIFRYIRKGEVLAMAGLHGADCEVLEFEVNPKSSINHKSLSKMKMPIVARIGGVIRDGVGIIPDNEFVFREDDHVVVLSKPDSIKKVENLFS